MQARTANAWWLLPGAFSLVAVLVINLSAGRLTSGAVDVTTGAGWYVAAAVAYMARPGNRTASLFLLTATLLEVGKALGAGISLAAASTGEVAHSWPPVVLVDLTGWAIASAGIALFAMYPDGRYQRRYERWITRGLPAAFLPLELIHLLGSKAIRSSQFGWVPLEAASPIHVSGLEPLGSLAAAVINASILVVGPALVLLLLRYRRFGPDQRRQIKWPLYAITLSAISVGVMGLNFGPPLIPFWVAAVQYVGTQALLPAGLAMGIVVHRSVDIEDVIRRSVVYGALWAIIGAAYVFVAAAFGIAAGQRVPLALAVVLAIVAALLFQPARNRLEQLADRLVFGRRVSGYELISQLGVRLQTAAAAEDVAGSVASAVHAGLDASWVRVILDGSHPSPVAAAGEVPAGAARADLSAPLVHDGRPIGLIECGPKRDGAYQPADQELLSMLGRQAALAIRNSQLSAELSARLEELAASRARLVHAEEAGRRRLERDLHDGVQQELVGVLARLGLVRNQIRRDQQLAEATLREAQVDAQHALEGLQELARGIHPAVLTDRGLFEAVAERATRMPIPVQLHADGLASGARFPPELEGAAYFFVSEGLANVLKYASADRASVRFGTNGGRLLVEVEDDGKGFDPERVTLSGLRGLQDRIEALGGRMELTCSPGRGTRLRADLPLLRGVS